MLQHRRILALWLPRLPTDRLIRRAKGAPFKAPLVVSAKIANALHVHALETKAARLGLYKGQPLANARAMVQPLCIVPADEKADTALLEDIADWCDRFTPLVMLDAADGLFLDITGATHLFGGEAAMLAMVTQKIADQGFAVRGAIAGTSLAAHALARFTPGMIVSPGGEAAAMASLPITALDPDDKALRALRHAGLKTVGQVAQRLHSELSERLGKAFVTRLRVMLGAEEAPLQPRRPLPDLMAEQCFAEPVVSEETIAASLLSLAGSLSEILERQGRGVRHLQAAFFRADGKLERIAIKTGEPLRDPTVMLRLLRQKLDTLADPLDPGFDLIRLEAAATEETKPGTISFDSDENAHRQIAFLVDRLSARFGSSRVQRFVPQDTHIPEAACVAIPAQDRDFGQENWALKRQPGEAPRRPLRLLEKPEEISAVAAVPDGPPMRFRWRQCLHEVARAEGPERIAMEWWRSVGEPAAQRRGRSDSVATPRDQKNDSGPTRDYFRIETDAGQRFWLYRDGLYHQTKLAPRWYLQGLFA